MFRGTTVIVSVTVMKTSVEFYSAQVTMHPLHYVTENYVTWIQSYNGARMHVHLTKMTDSKSRCLQGKCQINMYDLLIEVGLFPFYVQKIIDCLSVT